MLQDFLVPYKRLAAAVQECLTIDYMQSDSVMRAVAWADEADEANASTSLSRVYRAVDEACDTAVEVMLEVQQSVIQAGVSLEKCVEAETVQPQKEGKTNGKQVRLKVLAAVFSELGKLCRGESESIRSAYRALMLVFRFPTPHRLKHALF